MKKAHLFILILLVGSIIFAGCGKSENQKKSNPEKKQSGAQLAATALPTEKIPETPEPTEATFNMKQGYSDASREISILGLKEYKKIKSDSYTDKAKKGKKYLALFLKVSNKGSDKDYFHTDYLTAKLDGKDIQNTFLLNEPEGYPTIFTNIAADMTQAGFIVWEVPSDWKKLEVKYNGWQDSAGLSLHTTLTKKDLRTPEKYNPNI